MRKAKTCAGVTKPPWCHDTGRDTRDTTDDFCELLAEERVRKEKMACARSTWCIAAVVALGAALPGCGAFQACGGGTFAPGLRRAASLPRAMGPQRVARHVRTQMQAGPSKLDKVFHKKGTTWGTPPELLRVDPLDERTKNVIKFAVDALKGLITFLFQGEGREFARFYVLETVARVPYFSYLSVLHLFESLGFHERAAWIKVCPPPPWRQPRGKS